MIVLATDFGLEGPYVGQVKAVLLRHAPEVPVIDLFADLPPFRPDLAAHLIAAYADAFAPGDVVLVVVDPGVGTERAALAVNADRRWFVGPDNGVLEIVLRRAGPLDCRRITWRPASLSATFHGRDLFAPAAAMLARGLLPAGEPALPTRHPDWPDELAQIVYLDRYGNAMTGMRTASLPADAELEAGGRRARRARTFADVAPGTPLWYENANGLAEIAINGGSAARELGLAPGAPVRVHAP